MGGWVGGGGAELVSVPHLFGFSQGHGQLLHNLGVMRRRCQILLVHLVELGLQEIDLLPERRQVAYERLPLLRRVRIMWRGVLRDEETASYLLEDPGGVPRRHSLVRKTLPRGWQGSWRVQGTHLHRIQLHGALRLVGVDRFDHAVRSCHYHVAHVQSAV